MDRAVTCTVLLALLVLAAVVRAAEADEGRASSSYPEHVGMGVDPRNHAYWPVRVRSLDQIRWTFAEGQQAGMAAPIGAGLLFIQAGGGGIRGVEAGTGKRWWIAPGKMDCWNYSSCVLGPGNIAYGGNFHWVQAVDRRGKQLWKTDLRSAWIHAPPAVSPDGKTVYVSGDGLGIAALEAATGRVIWLRRDFRGSWRSCVFDEQGRFIASTKQGLVAYDANGAEVWKHETRLGHLMVIEDLLIGTSGSTMHALDLATQESVWSLSLGQKIRGAAYRDDGRIVVSLLSGELAVVELDGRLRCRRTIAPTGLYRPSAVMGGETLVADAQGRLYLCSASLAVASQIDTGDQPLGWRPTVSREGLVYLAHRKTVVCVTGLVRPPPKPVVASELLIVADDFVVDVWVNGELVPIGARRMIGETHGATHESLCVDLHEDDWVVFHVVANRLRWGGASYFGVHAVAPDGTTAFTSALDGPWWSCDDPSHVAAFVADARTGRDRPVVPPAKPWSDARRIWRDLLGTDFAGEPVWGKAPSTWIKTVVQEPPAGDDGMGPEDRLPEQPVDGDDPPPPPPREPGTPPAPK